MKPTIKKQRKKRSTASKRGPSKTRHGLWFKAKVQQQTRQAMMRKTKNGNRSRSRQGGQGKQGQKKAQQQKARAKARRAAATAPSINITKSKLACLQRIQFALQNLQPSKGLRHY
jgi:hypothetical protein